MSRSAPMTMRWYRLGDGSLGVDSEDGALAERFEVIYGGCAADGPGTGPLVVCRVGPERAGAVHVEFDDPEPLAISRFLAAVFPERGYDTTDRGADFVVRLPESAHEMRFRGDAVVAPADSAWRPFVANLAIARLLRLQREVIFFHAASARIGEGGMMACGPKRSGKTTLALGLAARGHLLLGDEVAAVRLPDRALLPFRRSVAARAGPRSHAASVLVARTEGVVERFPDGEERTRLPMASINPSPAPTSATLTTLLLLRSIVPKTLVRTSLVHPALLGALTPLAASLWDRPAGESAFRLLRLLAGVRVFEVDSGPPDELVDRVERLMEEG